MTIDLFGIQDALDAEKKEYQRLKKIRQRILRRWGTEEEVVEGASNALVSHSPQEAQKSSSPVETP